MKNVSRITRASAALACALAVAGAASAGTTAQVKVLPRGGEVVASIAIPPETGGIAAGEGAVWTMSSAVSTLTRISPSGNVVAKIAVKPTKPCPPSPDACGEIAAGNGAVWVTLTPDNAVVRVDPRTNRIVAKIPVGPGPQGIAISPGAVWVANANGPSVSRIDPATNKLAATIRVAPAKTCCNRMAVGVGGDAVWATVAENGAVVRIDPATNKVMARKSLASVERMEDIGSGVRWVHGDHTHGPRLREPTQGGVAASIARPAITQRNVRLKLVPRHFKRLEQTVLGA